MSTIKIENLTFSYYGYVKPVFDNVSFSFDTNWKTGLSRRPRKCLGYLTPYEVYYSTSLHLT